MHLCVSYYHDQPAIWVHVENDSKYILELISRTKKGGTIIIGTPNKYRLSNKLISFIKGPIKYPYKLGYHFESGGDIIHIREYTASELENLAKKNNLNDIKIYSSFLGIYLPYLGAVGIKKFDLSGIYSKYCQHLFLVIKNIK